MRAEAPEKIEWAIIAEIKASAKFFAKMFIFTSFP
jgi:hypothetical protein